MFWQTTRFRIDLSTPRIMGIVNVTPDSFSDGGRHQSAAAALAHCERLLADGADILDIGGESTRPGALPATLEEELERVLPVVEGAVRLGCPVSVDTSKPEVITAVLALGADIVNDVAALEAPGAVDAAAAHPSCGVCLMHMRGVPRSMQQNPSYGDVVAEVAAYLRARGDVLQQHGIATERVVFDPGIGFGKNAAHNLELLRRQRELQAALARPLLVGWSRKSTLGTITGRAVDDRVVASVAAALLSVEAGARIVRVHDVAPTRDALKVWCAVQGQIETIPRL